jgi:hypothetical protein
MAVMKNYLLNIALVFNAVLFLPACSKNDSNTSNGTCHILEVCLTGEKKCDSDISFIAAKKEYYKISVDNSNLCPSHFLQLELRSDNNLIIDSVFTDRTKYEKIVAFNAGSHIDVKARTIPGQPLVECIWMGEATISICKE